MATVYVAFAALTKIKGITRQKMKVCLIIQMRGQKAGAVLTGVSSLPGGDDLPSSLTMLLSLPIVGDACERRNPDPEERKASQR